MLKISDKDKRLKKQQGGGGLEITLLRIIAGFSMEIIC